VLQIIRQTVLYRSALLGGVIGDLAQPVPGLSHHVVVAAHVHGAIQVASRRFAIAGLDFDDAATH
jgi:hypothetical protein